MGNFSMMVLNITLWFEIKNRSSISSEAWKSTRVMSLASSRWSRGHANTSRVDLSASPFSFSKVIDKKKLVRIEKRSFRTWGLKKKLEATLPNNISDFRCKIFSGFKTILAHDTNRNLNRVYNIKLYICKSYLKIIIHKIKVLLVKRCLIYVLRYSTKHQREVRLKVENHRLKITWEACALSRSIVLIFYPGGGGGEGRRDRGRTRDESLVGAFPFRYLILWRTLNLYE